MKRTSIVAGALAALWLPAFANEQGHEASAAQRAGLVMSVQTELGVAPVDGKIGPRTHAAVKEFQRAKGLEPSGQLDQETVTALGLDGPNSSAAAGGSTARISGSGKATSPAE